MRRDIFYTRSTRFSVLQDMCFWNTSIYKIYENQPVTMIGMFGPEAYSYVCPEFNVTRYELLNGEYLR